MTYFQDSVATMLGLSPLLDDSGKSARNQAEMTRPRSKERGLCVWRTPAAAGCGRLGSGSLDPEPVARREPLRTARIDEIRLASGSSCYPVPGHRE